MFRPIIIPFVCVLVACGGVIDPQPEPAPSSDDAATSDAAMVDEAAPDAAVEGSSLHFACLVLAASTPTFVECTTLPDGAPSYADDGNVDCRTYFEGAGQGCAPPTACTAWLNGEQLTGSCGKEP